MQVQPTISLDGAKMFAGEVACDPPLAEFGNVDVELKNFPADAPPTAHEVQRYISYVKNQVDKPLIKLRITYTPEDGGVDLKYTLRDEKFERIRRITGYLTGDLASWNNAKQAEERERIKHG